MNTFIEICTNCGKTFYQPLDRCCYCGSSFDLASYHRNWRKWYNSTLSNSFNFVKYSDFSKPTRNGAKKMAAGKFYLPRHSERLFELKTSEFRCEIKF